MVVERLSCRVPIPLSRNATLAPSGVAPLLAKTLSVAGFSPMELGLESTQPEMTPPLSLA